MPKVTIAENAGFCFGVKLATDKIEEALAKRDGTRLFTLGHLIHNAVYNERLEAQRVLAVTLEEMEKVAVLFHGDPRRAVGFPEEKDQRTVRPSASG